MRTRLIGTVAAIAVVAVALVGCSKLTTAFTPAPKVVTQEATLAVAGAAVNGALAEQMPVGLPLWPSAVVEKSALQNLPEGKSWSASFVTADAYDEVLGGTAAGFEKAGWAVEVVDSGTPEAKMSVLNVSKEGIEGVVSLTQNADKSTSVAYVLKLPQ